MHRFYASSKPFGQSPIITPRSAYYGTYAWHIRMAYMHDTHAWHICMTHTHGIYAWHIRMTHTSTGQQAQGQLTIRWVDSRIYAYFSSFFNFPAPQAKIFQKMININEKWSIWYFYGFFMIYFWSKILHYHENIKKWSKISKILKNFFFENFHFFFGRKCHFSKAWKNLFLDKNFRIFELRGIPWVQKWCFCPSMMSILWFPKIGHVRHEFPPNR